MTQATWYPVRVRLCLEKIDTHRRRRAKNHSFQQWQTPIRKAVQPPSDLLNRAQNTQARLKRWESLIPKRHKVVHTTTKLEREGCQQARSVFKDLSRFSSLLLFSLTKSLLLSCHSPPTVRGELFFAVTKGLLAATAQAPSLTHFLAQHFQGDAAAQGHPRKFPIFQE